MTPFILSCFIAACLLATETPTVTAKFNAGVPTINQPSVMTSFTKLYTCYFPAYLFSLVDHYLINVARLPKVVTCTFVCVGLHLKAIEMYLAFIYILIYIFILI